MDVRVRRPGGQSGLETLARGVASLMLSPSMIVAGLAQGIAFLPYTLGASLNDLNRALVEAKAVSPDDSYKAAFNVPIADSRVNQQTGEIAGADGLYRRYRPEAIFEANKAFQRLLVSQRMPEEKAEHYVLAVDSRYAWTHGHILLTIVYRYSGKQPFRVASKHTGITSTFRPNQRGWYEPYARGVDGKAIDEVIDWAALEYSMLRQDRVIATLISIGVESVKSGKRAHDFWQVEQRWVAGSTTEIMQESLAKVKDALSAA